MNTVALRNSITQHEPLGDSPRARPRQMDSGSAILHCPAVRSLGTLNPEVAFYLLYLHYRNLECSSPLLHLLPFMTIISSHSVWSLTHVEHQQAGGASGLCPVPQEDPQTQQTLMILFFTPF